MRIWVAVEHTSHFVERVATLLMEVTFAAAVILGGVLVGHELREWREWYWTLPPAFDSPTSAPAVSEP
jgi:hypothetical protein